MTDEIEMIFEGTQQGTSYIESLVKSRVHLNNLFSYQHPIIIKLEQVIVAELELALLDAEKAKNDRLKANKDNIKPIKG